MGSNQDFFVVYFGYYIYNHEQQRMIKALWKQKMSWNDKF
jgi:hypothetical protein